MKLSHAVPDMAIPALRRLEQCLATDCTCGSDRGQLCRREIAPENRPKYWTVWLQCLTCGRGVAGPLSLSDQFQWKSYPEWDPLLRERWDADRQARFEAAAAAEREAYAKAVQERRGEYALFLSTDLGWKELRLRILRRSRGICEACLKSPAVAVHHMTYASGLMPPAHLLQAVCQHCHDRYHTAGDDWCSFSHAAE